MPETHAPAGERPFEQDLRPDFLEGDNDGIRSPHPELTAPTAFDVKEVHNRLDNFADEDLKQIPILPAGTRLSQGATYIDLAGSDRQEFTATGDMEAGTANWYVPKSSVPYWIWNRLIGVRNPERLDEGGNA